MKNYYFTFGVQYKQIAHPKYKKANPDGWVRVEAQDHGTARQYFVNEVAGLNFATSYDEENFLSGTRAFFPDGEIERFRVPPGYNKEKEDAV